MNFNDFHALLESILLEGKIDDLKAKYAEHRFLSPSIVDHYHNALPEGHKSLANLKWMLDRHIDGGLTPAWAEDVGKNIAYMNHPDIRPHLEKKQLSQYKNNNELERALEPHIDKLLATQDKAKVVYQSPSITVKEHPDHASAVQAAKLPSSNPHAADLNGKASWCVSVDHDNGGMYFDRYTNGGVDKMHTIEVSHPDGHTRKYAVINAANEFRDEHDNSFSPSKFVMKDHPELLKTEIGRDMLGDKAKLFNENGEYRPLHQVITRQNGPAVERDPIVTEHPDWGNEKALADIVEDPKTHGKEAAHFAFERLRNISGTNHYDRAADAIASHPDDYHALTTASAIRVSNGERLKTFARNIRDSHHVTPHIAFAFKNHSYTNGDTIHEMITDPKVSGRTKEALIQHDDVKPETIRHVMNHHQEYNENTKFHAASHSKISSEDIHAAVTNPNMDRSFRNGAVYNSKMGEHTENWILSNAERESNGNQTHYMNLAANKIKRERTVYESFEERVVMQFLA